VLQRQEDSGRLGRHGGGICPGDNTRRSFDLAVPRGRCPLSHPDAATDPDPFTFSGGIVDPGETANLRYTISETYLGEPVRIPVTIINGTRPGGGVSWPGWRTVVDSGATTWLRADAGGLVDIRHDRGDLVEEGDVICRITNRFKPSTERVRAPFTGLLVGVLENPVVSPGTPLCHIVELDAGTRRAYERDVT
jgi:hypothetical protein